MKVVPWQEVVDHKMSKGILLKKKQFLKLTHVYDCARTHTGHGRDKSPLETKAQQEEWHGRKNSTGTTRHLLHSGSCALCKTCHGGFAHGSLVPRPTFLMYAVSQSIQMNRMIHEIWPPFCHFVHLKILALMMRLLLRVLCHAHTQFFAWMLNTYTVEPV